MDYSLLVGLDLENKELVLGIIGKLNYIVIRYENTAFENANSQYVNNTSNNSQLLWTIKSQSAHLSVAVSA